MMKYNNQGSKEKKDGNEHTPVLPPIPVHPSMSKHLARSKTAGRDQAAQKGQDIDRTRLKIYIYILVILRLSHFFTYFE